MKIVCNVMVGNRLLPTLGMRDGNKGKFVKSTLAICKKPKSDDEFCVILFSSSNSANKNGTKYEVKNNIQCVLTKFIQEGKATIQFINPAHDLFIRGDKIQVKSFIHLLGRAFRNKVSEKEIKTFSNLSVTACTKKDIALTKLQIRKRGDYPLRGFPRTLEELTISEINRMTLDKGILKLLKLRILDLSHNLIEELPEEFNLMPCLAELNLAYNKFGKSHPKTWAWMNSLNLSRTLKLLNLTGNSMKFLPDQLLKLSNLITLNVDDNLLTILPSGIGSLKNLRTFTATRNELKSLPGSVKKLCLQTIDVSNNNFDPVSLHNPNLIKPNCVVKPLPCLPLKEISAKEVLLNKSIFYKKGDLPETLIKYLDLAKFCVCGKPCFNLYLEYKHIVSLSSIAQSYVFSSLGSNYVPIDCCFCSVKCFTSIFANRIRHPTV